MKTKLHDGRLPHNPNTPDKLSTDHAGHLVADLFGGSPKLDNLVSQDGLVNLKDYRKLEILWYNALKAGKKVEVSIKLSYEANSKRPKEFNIRYRLEGQDWVNKKRELYTSLH